MEAGQKAWFEVVLALLQRMSKAWSKVVKALLKSVVLIFVLAAYRPQGFSRNEWD